MRHTRRVVDGEAKGGEAGSARPLRSAAPEWAGPLGSSGAAPEESAPAAEKQAPQKAPAPEPAKPEPAKPEPAKPEPAKAEPAKAEPAATEPTKPEPTKPEPAQPEPAQPEPAQPEPAATEPVSEWARPAAGEEKGAAAPGATPPAPDAGTTPPVATDQPTVTVASAPVDVLENGPGPRRRPRFAHALRRGPRARAMARGVRAWSGRPSGRLTLPAVLLLVLVVAGAGAGAIAIPMMAGSRQAAPAATASGDVTPTPDFAGGEVPLPSTGPPVVGGATPSPGATVTTAPPAGARPADVLAAWATQVGGKVDVPWVAMQAYGYAEWVLSQTRPGCNLRWTTLAAIGKIESNHGRHNATLGNDGESSPKILGPVLNGTNNTLRIDDTDDGVLDGDLTYDRAVGAMQFIPSTWRQHEIDADNDGLKDINDIDDAALAAGNYLCQGGRDMDRATDWWNAILSYNNVRPYAQAVFDAANQYGTRSRT
jgi:hypothetical protein